MNLSQQIPTLTAELAAVNVRLAAMNARIAAWHVGSDNEWNAMTGERDELRSRANDLAGRIDYWEQKIADWQTD